MSKMYILIIAFACLAIAFGGGYWVGKKRLFTASLTLIAISFCSSCARTSFDFCPTWPVAGEKVAAELERFNYSENPNTWEWLGRIDKLRQELEICRK
ncbi:MAG: hypothetical protein IJ660_00795 [Alphaproteobacteria bacterium]|nr:hypothetical protein [Alphaproteobacteria bacterium]